MRRILAEVRVPVPDLEESDGIQRDDDNNEVYEIRQVSLHHWGTQSESSEDRNGNTVISQYTVAICEDQETGQIHTFMPTQLKILGLTTYR